jgi:beta-phosphoglucomutase-like phosphatase (HAD superfamily)
MHRHFGARYTIETMRVHGTFRPKPSRSMLRTCWRAKACRGASAVLVEDSAANLRAARAVGFRTVLVTGHSRGRAGLGRAAVTSGCACASVLELARRRCGCADERAAAAIGTR